MMRTFISVDVPITDEIEGILGRMRSLDNIRPVPKDQIHLTLKFLGDTDEKDVKRVCDSLKDVLSGTGPFDICVKGVGAFPDKKHARVVWLGVKEPEPLIETADKVDSVVKGMRLSSDDKRFSPHITVGRINGRADLKDIFERYRDTEFCRFSCGHVDVMKSVLTPKGAIHSVVERIEL